MQNSDFFLYVLDKITDGVQVADLTGQLVFVNRLSSQRLGIPQDKVAAYRVQDFEPIFEQPGAWEAHVEQLRTNGQEVVFSRNKNLENQQWVDVEVRVSLEKIGDQEYVIAVARDITEQVKARRQLAQSEQTLRSMSEALPGLLLRYKYFYDGSDEIQYVSQGIVLLWELEPEAAMRDPSLVWNKIHPDDVPGLANSLDEASKSLSTWSHEYRVCMDDGRVKWVTARGMPTKEPDGVLWHTIAIDITRRKAAEQEREETILQLEKLNNELDNFIYRVSHDLRAPLTSAIGLTRLIMQTTDELDRSNYLDLMETSLEKLDSFIKDILDFSRNSRTGVAFTRVDLRKVVQDLLDQHQGLKHPNHQIALALNHQQPLFTDALRIQMVLNNLVSNSLKFTQPYDEAPQLSIETTTQGDCWELSVKDNGVGIDPELHGRVFDMFFRASATQVGSGLGLYIAKEAVEAMGGSISVRSAVGHGCEFIVRLPLGATGQA